MSSYVNIFNDFIEEQDCNALIDKLNYLKKNNQLTLRRDGRLCVENSQEPIFLNIVDKYYKKIRALTDDEYKYIFGYILSVYCEGVGMPAHVDSLEGEEVGALFYLNDDYSGGELEVLTPEGIFTYTPKKRDLVYFPSWFRHEVLPVKSGIRYFFTISLLKTPTSQFSNM